MQNTIEHQGVIISIDDKVAHVKIEQTSACASCHVKSVCGASEKSEKIIDANLMDASLKIGDQVTVIGQKSLGIQAILLAYVLPFVLIVVILFFANIFTTNELVIGTCALASLIPYFAVLRLMRNKIQAKFQFYAIKK
ncbi:MAG: SoxR reducing system RseC family protein [Paludibacteraceae bacterium]|jgi:sigma-E factor negative regulatory protein RseC|nr:SoxR reducing system RseC family protein [Paludibacteraceae bacterium]